MKNYIILICLAALLGAVSFADEAQDQQAIMKGLGKASGSLRKNIEAKAMDDAAKDAQTMVELFKKEEAWWAGKNAPDAVKFSQDGQAAAQATSAALSAGNSDEAMADSKKIGATCGGCHTAHREKLEGGGYKTK